ncbi:MAG: hypothetical protein JNL01_15635 [Bdellovibrionales bacterium]|nr:hypothetical protein [Bdellovibrionales bacterium]
MNPILLPLALWAALTSKNTGDPQFERDPFLGTQVFVTEMRNQAEGTSQKSTFEGIARRMPPKYRLLFLAQSCEGKPFKLSELVPSIEERRILTDGRLDDLQFPGVPNESFCKKVGPQDVLDPNAMNLNDAVKMYLGDVKNQKKCSVAGFEKWNDKRLVSNGVGENPRSKIGIFNQKPGLKMVLRLTGQGSSTSLIENGSGQLSYEVNGKKFSLPVEMEERGGVRPFMCKDFPPFKMILPDKGKSPLFAGADRDMKVVTHCKKNARPIGLREIYREYAVYRILEASGLVHFQTQLVEMEYLKKDGTLLTKGPAILIENQKDAFDRMTDKEGRLRDPYFAGDLALEAAEDLASNHDWYKGHNSRDLAGFWKEAIWVAYDFDLTDLVQLGKADSQVGAYMKNVSASQFASSRDGQEIIRRFVQNREAMLLAVYESPMSSDDQYSFEMYVRAKVDAYEKLMKKANN